MIQNNLLAAHQDTCHLLLNVASYLPGVGLVLIAIGAARSWGCRVKMKSPPPSPLEIRRSCEQMSHIQDLGKALHWSGAQALGIGNLQRSDLRTV